jgi:hypothetical protein
MNSVFVIVASYPDGSGHKLIRAYVNRAVADDILGVIEESQPSMLCHVEEVELEGAAI